MPYPIRPVTAEVQADVPSRKGKKKTAGGPSCAKVTKKRKDVEQARTKRTHPREP